MPLSTICAKPKEPLVKYNLERLWSTEEGPKSQPRAAVTLGTETRSWLSSGLVPQTWEHGSGEFSFLSYQLGVQTCWWCQAQLMGKKEVMLSAEAPSGYLWLSVCRAAQGCVTLPASQWQKGTEHKWRNFPSANIDLLSTYVLPTSCSCLCFSSGRGLPPVLIIAKETQGWTESCSYKMFYKYSIKWK